MRCPNCQTERRKRLDAETALYLERKAREMAEAVALSARHAEQHAMQMWQELRQILAEKPRERRESEDMTRGT